MQLAKYEFWPNKPWIKILTWLTAFLGRITPFQWQKGIKMVFLVEKIRRKVLGVE